MWHPDPFTKHPIPPTTPPSLEAVARSRWFSPLRVGRLDLAERTWVPAMVPWRATDDAAPSARRAETKAATVA